jgi:hypothetical protein
MAEAVASIEGVTFSPRSTTVRETVAFCANAAIGIESIRAIIRPICPPLSSATLNFPPTHIDRNIPHQLIDMQLERQAC